MARNEEKQLARLNRFYLSKQKEEEFKKRPPRPKLESLSTVYEIKKWLPSVMRDIEFYVKQMEVACYPDRQIKEFETRIDHLRGEYKAFVRKIRQLEPDLSATPWSDRPYAAKQRKTEASSTYVETVSDNSPPDKADTTTKNENLQQSSTSFVPIPVPVLNNDALLERCFGYGVQREPTQTETNPEIQDKPLDFNKRNLPGYNKFCGGVTPCHQDVADGVSETVPCCHATVKPCHPDVADGISETVPCCHATVTPCHHDVADGVSETVLCCHATVTPCRHATVTPCHQDVADGISETVPCCHATVTPCHQDVADGISETVPCCHATVTPCHPDVADGVSETVPCLTMSNPHSGVGSVTTVSAEGTLNIPYPDSSSEDEIT
ncbi:uncharacterized protein LOC131936473 [Physella acuta]|uniref:uncharacterized protein LOC131936473 n=1 Tax=Physella acuta TaxID=109671 RepID=UPI0027DBF39E|nr:uncharacterized protein LOC131936473 [Physella acuta]